MPAPFGPTSAVTEPDGTSSAQSRNAHFEPYRLPSPSARNAVTRPSSPRAVARCRRTSAAMFSSSRPAARARPIQRRSAEAQLLHAVGRRRRRLARDERAHAAPPLDQPLAVQLAVGLEHRVRVDRQAADDVLHRRQLISGPRIPSRTACRTCWTSWRYVGIPERLSRWNSITVSAFSSCLDKAFSSETRSACQAPCCDACATPTDRRRRVAGGTGLAIEATGLRKRYGSVIALDGVDLRVETGIVSACSARTAPGKTTRCGSSRRC